MRALSIYRENRGAEFGAMTSLHIDSRQVTINVLNEGMGLCLAILAIHPDKSTCGIIKHTARITIEGGPTIEDGRAE